MYRIVSCGMGVLVFAAVLASLAGCSGPVFSVKVENIGDFPLTSVRFIPVLENAAQQADAFEDAVNLLPRDDDDVTMAVGAGQATMLTRLLAGDFYYVAVTYYIMNEYVEHVYAAPVDLTGLQKCAVVTMAVRCDFPENSDDPAFDIFFTY